MRVTNLAQKILQGHKSCAKKNSDIITSSGRPVTPRPRDNENHRITESPNQRIINELRESPNQRITMNANHRSRITSRESPNHFSRIMRITESSLANRDHLQQTHCVVQASDIASLKTGMLRPLQFLQIHGIIDYSKGCIMQPPHDFRRHDG